MPRSRGWFVLIFALLCVPAAVNAQATTTTVTLSFTTNMFGNDLQGPGTINPFGTGTIDVNLAGHDVTVTLSATDSFVLTGGTFNGGVNGGSAQNMSITSGTGLFKGATGTISFSFALDKNGQWPLSGTGSVTLANQTGGPGGSGYPTAGPGGPGYPYSSLGGAQIVACDGIGAGGGSSMEAPGPPANAQVHREALIIATEVCTNTSSDSSNLYFPIYDTSDPNIQTQLSFWISQQELQAAEQAEKDYQDMILHLSQSIKSGVNRDAAAAASTNPAMSVVTPVQSSAATYTATANCPGSPANCFISVPVSSGNIAASSRAAITAVVDPASLGPGVHHGNVAITISNGSKTTNVITQPVTVAINTSAPLLSVSQTGLQFQAVTGSTIAQSQVVAVAAAAGNISFTASASTLSGGTWLSVAPASGSVTAGGSANVTVQANPSGLAAGQYFGAVTISSSGAVDSPRLIDVVLTVGTPANAGPLVSPSALNFLAPASGNPASQSTQFINLSSQTLAVTATPQFGSGVTGWFSVTSSASSVAAGQTLTETVAINVQGLAAGAYVGNLDLHVAQLNADYFVPVVLVVPTGALLGGPVQKAFAPAACTPSKLLPMFTNLLGGFQATAGLPLSIQVNVTDDCGNPLNTGGVLLYFPGSGDEPSEMAPLGNGQWGGSWLPHNAGGGQAAIGVLASESTPALIGSTGVAGTVAANSSTPIVNPGGVVSAASVAAGAPLPLAPGEFISIFGQNLASAGSVNAISAPYQTKLGPDQAMLGGEAMPLQVSAAGQINAVVPYDAAVGSVEQIMVELNGTSYSMPEPVIIAAAQPSIFTQDQSGSGAGAILTASAKTGAVALNTASAPAHAGDVLEVYCTGLGTVSPAVPVGTAASLTTLSYTDNTVTATIGGVAAQVQFSGLAPGYAALYQVNVTVPAGVTGSTVPLVLSEVGAVSPPVTVAIQ